MTDAGVVSSRTGEYALVPARSVGDDKLVAFAASVWPDRPPHDATPSWPVVGKYLGRRAPQFMWWPKGPASGLTVDKVALTFADATIDFDL
jgi:hypothetical protein